MKFRIEEFEERTSSLGYYIEKKTEKEAREYAIELSKEEGIHHVTIEYPQGWETWEGGEKTAWSLSMEDGTGTPVIALGLVHSLRQVKE